MLFFRRAFFTPPGQQVTLGPPAANYVWGVHTTPSSVAATATATAVQVSWLLGSYSVSTPLTATLAAFGAACVSPCIGNLVNTPSPGAFVVRGPPSRPVPPRDFSLRCLDPTDASLCPSGAG